MAKRDFAQVKAPSRPEKKKGKRGSGKGGEPASGSIIPAIAILLVAAACFGGGFWLGTVNLPTSDESSHALADQQQALTDIHQQMTQQAKALQAQIASQQQRIAQLKTEVAKWKQRANRDAYSKVGELDFYTKLPKQPVTPAPVSTPAPAAVAQTSRKNGSSRHHTEAPAPTPKPSQQVKSTPKISHIVAAEKRVHKHQKAAPNHHFYRLQLASFPTHADAEQTKARLTRAGFPVTIEARNLGAKGVWHRLYAGPYATHDSAAAALVEIKKVSHLKGFIVRDR